MSTVLPRVVSRLTSTASTTQRVARRSISSSSHSSLRYHVPSILSPNHYLSSTRYQSTSTTPPTSSATTAAAIPFRTHIGPLPSSTSIPLTPTAHVFWHSPTSTWTYIVVCPTTKQCVIIDPALDFDPSTSTVSTETADSLLEFIKEKGYEVTKILETHAHADHLTSARYLQVEIERRSSKRVEVGIGELIRQTQEYFAKQYDIDMKELEGSFDRLWKDGEKFELGDCQVEVLHLPGHTADHVGYKFGSFVFVGDSIFLPTVGSARADFPFGSSTTLYNSSQKLLSLPPTTRLFSGHHYPSTSTGEKNVCSATVEEQKQLNRHLKEGVGKEEFVKLREERDGGLKEPTLLHQSLQVNIRGGRLPKSKNTGQPYLRIPIKGAPEGL